MWFQERTTAQGCATAALCSPHLTCGSGISLPAGSTLSGKNTLLQSVSVKEDFLSAARCRGTAGSQNGVVWCIPRSFQSPAKEKGGVKSPCPSQDPPSSLVCLCWLQHEGGNLSRALAVLSARLFLRVSPLGASRGMQGRGEPAAGSAAARRAGSVLFRLRSQLW